MNYLNQRINNIGSRPLGLQDLYQLKDVVSNLMPGIKFSDIIQEVLYGIKAKNLSGIALHKYYLDKIEKLERKISEMESK
ncbi:hypothetical protein OAQ99_03090 [Candidatus Kapabacteria bacterium]|nr:hypothetical protein [Candidatus Kapabacteria bacterium]